MILAILPEQLLIAVTLAPVASVFISDTISAVPNVFISATASAVHNRPISVALPANVVTSLAFGTNLWKVYDGFAA